MLTLGPRQRPSSPRPGAHGGNWLHRVYIWRSRELQLSPKKLKPLPSYRLVQDRGLPARVVERLRSKGVQKLPFGLCFGPIPVGSPRPNPGRLHPRQPPASVNGGGRIIKPSPAFYLRPWSAEQPWWGFQCSPSLQRGLILGYDCV